MVNLTTSIANIFKSAIINMINLIITNHLRYNFQIFTIIS